MFVGDLAAPPFSEVLTSKRGSRLNVKDATRDSDPLMDAGQDPGTIKAKRRCLAMITNVCTLIPVSVPEAHLQTVIEHSISKDERDGHQEGGYCQYTHQKEIKEACREAEGRLPSKKTQATSQIQNLTVRVMAVPR